MALKSTQTRNSDNKIHGINNNNNTTLWWVDPGCTLGALQSCSINPTPQLYMGEKISRKDHESRYGQGEIIHQLLSKAKQI